MICYEDEKITRLRNRSISSEMIGNLRLDKSHEKDMNDPSNNIYAIATLDGLIMLARRETILW